MDRAEKGKSGILILFLLFVRLGDDFSSASLLYTTNQNIHNATVKLCSMYNIQYSAESKRVMDRERKKNMNGKAMEAARCREMGMGHPRLWYVWWQLSGCL